MGKLNEHDPLYDDMSFLENKKLKKDRRKQKFKKKTPKTFKRRDSRKAIIKKGKYK